MQNDDFSADIMDDSPERRVERALQVNIDGADEKLLGLFEKGPWYVTHLNAMSHPDDVPGERLVATMTMTLIAPEDVREDQAMIHGVTIRSILCALESSRDVIVNALKKAAKDLNPGILVTALQLMAVIAAGCKRIATTPLEAAGMVADEMGLSPDAAGKAMQTARALTGETEQHIAPMSIELLLAEDVEPGQEDDASSAPQTGYVR